MFLVFILLYFIFIYLFCYATLNFFVVFTSIFIGCHSDYVEIQFMFYHSVTINYNSINLKETY